MATIVRIFDATECCGTPPKLLIRKRTREQDLMFAIDGSVSVEQRTQERLEKEQS